MTKPAEMEMTRGKGKASSSRDNPRVQAAQKSMENLHLNSEDVETQARPRQDQPTPVGSMDGKHVEREVDSKDKSL
jgi:hypothetical protein